TPDPGLLRPARRRAPGGRPRGPGPGDRSGGAARGRPQGVAGHRPAVPRVRGPLLQERPRPPPPAPPPLAGGPARARGGDQRAPGGAGRGEDEGGARTARRVARVDVALADGPGPVLDLRPDGGTAAELSTGRAGGPAYGPGGLAGPLPGATTAGPGGAR